MQANQAMRVLVTGGAGFIGTNLIPKLMALGHPIRILDNLSAGQSGHTDSPPVEFLQGDIRDQRAVDEAVKGCVAVVHLAAQTNVQHSLKNPREDFQINVEGILNLLEASVKHGVKKFVFASSNAAVGQMTPPVHEAMPAKPLAPYGASKLAGEAYCSAFYHSYGLDSAALRFANVYGPFSSHKSSVVARFFREGMDENVLTIYGDGRQTRDFVYVGDLCEAIVVCLGKEKLQGEVFQIASGRETSVLDLAEKVKSLLPHGPTIRFLPARKADIVRNVSCIDKAKEILGFQPRTLLNEGLAQTYAWFMRKENLAGHVPSRHQVSDAHHPDVR
nr:NAD-dependent epimerase/dehydratase family protein [Nitrospirota bacterium]